jgi:hypothetical protein
MIFLVFGGVAVVISAGMLVTCCTGARRRGAQLNNSEEQRCPHAARQVEEEPHAAALPEEAIAEPAEAIPIPLPAPVITLVAPAMGTTGGGTRVVITGMHFGVGTAVVRFDNIQVPVITGTGTQIEIDAPSHLAGAVSVWVTNADHQFDSAERAYTYRREPEVMAILPDAGPVCGNNTVEITGRYFAPAVSVRIGGHLAGNVQRIDEQTIRASVPARHAAQPPGLLLAVEVVNTNDGGRGRLAEAYQYRPLRITAVLPTFGTSAGGAVLTIAGTGFDAGTTVSIGGFAVGNVVVVSPTEITGTAPALPSHGDVECDVIATSGAGVAQADTLADGFNYLAPVTLVAVAPASGARDVEVDVMLLGMGFTDPMTSYVDGLDVTTVVAGGNMLTARIPVRAHPGAEPRAVPVIARNAGNQSSTLADGYTYDGALAPMHVVLYPGGHDFTTIAAAGGNDANLITQLQRMHNTGQLDGSEAAADNQIPGRTYHNHIVGGAGGLLFCRHAHAIHTIYQVLDVTLHRPDNNYSRNLLAHNPTNGRWHPNAGSRLAAVQAHAVSMALNFAGAGAVLTAINNTFTLLSVEPASGATANCDAITIRGRNIPNLVEVRIGGALAVINFQNATTINVTPANRAAGTVPVRVIEEPGARDIYVELAGAFAYENLALTALTPAIGSHDGGNLVVITGTGFNAGAAVSFDGTLSNTVQVLNSRVITVSAPAHAAGVVNVTVTVNGANLTLPYRYVQ